MRKFKGKRLQLLSSREVSQDWEATLLPWPSLCRSATYKESSNTSWNECNVGASSRYPTELNDTYGWSEVSVEHWLPERYER